MVWKIFDKQTMGSATIEASSSNQSQSYINTKITILLTLFDKEEAQFDPLCYTQIRVLLCWSRKTHLHYPCPTSSYFTSPIRYILYTKIAQIVNLIAPTFDICL